MAYQHYGDNWKAIVEEDKNAYMNKVSSLLASDPRLEFSVERDLKRLTEQSKGDSAFYFLSILSFIEGFLRSEYRDVEGFDFDDTHSISLSQMINHAKNNLPSHKQPTRKQLKNLHYLFNFMRTHSNMEKELHEDINGRKELVVTKAPTEFYIDGDRIRHCFTEQTDDNVRLLIGEFVEFSKTFNFYEQNREIIDSLYDDDKFFKNLKEHKPEEESLLSKEIARAIIEAMNKGSKAEKEAAKEIFNNRQAEQARYARTWRNYQTMMSHLTEEQEEISNEILAKIKKDKKVQTLIKGGPGTGKTLILINILQTAFGKDIKLLTYTNTLTKYNKYLSGLISFNGTSLDDNDKKKIIDRISGFDDYFISISLDLFRKQVLPFEKIAIVEELASKANISLSELIHEAREIWLHLPRKEKYIDLTFVQTKKASKEIQKSRKIMWDLVDELEKEFKKDESKQIPLEYAFYAIQKKYVKIPEEKKCDYLLIDEIQDLEAAKIEAVKLLSRKGFVLAGDKTQSVFVRKGLPWLHLKAQEIPSPEQELTKNFRSTRPIQDLANAYRKDLAIKDDEAVSNGFMPGPNPEAYVSKDQNVILEKLIERIKFMKEQLCFDNHDFCIVGANDVILNKIKAELDRNQFDSVFIESDSFDFNGTEDSIRLSKIKYVKGVDIPVILLVLDEDFIDLEGKKNDGLDFFAQENSIYTCISRAMNILNVFFVDGENLFKENESKKLNNAVLKLYNIMKENVILLD